MHSTALLTDPVRPLLMRLSAPLLVGSTAALVFATTPMAFISRLGPQALTVIGFTLPVAFLTAGLVAGLTTGAGTAMAHAIGARPGASQAARGGACLLLAVLLAPLAVWLGWLTIGPTFSLLGAPAELMPQITAYMRIWWLCLFFEMPLAVGAALVQAVGNTRFPALVTVLKALANVVLCPLLVFGLGPIPALGIAGAAWAMVLTELLTLLPVLWMLRRLKLVGNPMAAVAEEGAASAGAGWGLWSIWRAVAVIAVPTAITHCMVPFSFGAVTRLAAGLGPEMVAALSTAVRIESFALLVTAALGSALITFTGQNWGARLYARVQQGGVFCDRFVLAWGVVVWVLLVLIAQPLARCFTDDPAILRPLVLFLVIAPAGYAHQGLIRTSSCVMSATGQPHMVTLLNLGRLFGLYVPLTYTGAWLFGVKGMWTGVALSNVLGGIGFAWWLRRFWQRQAAGACQA